MSFQVPPNIAKLIGVIVQEYQSETVPDDVNLEFEVRFAKISKDAFCSIHQELLKRGYQAKLEQSINTISANVFERSERAMPRNTQYIRHMKFDAGKKTEDKHMVKTPTRDVRVRGYLDHKIALSKESDSKPFTVARDALVRFKVRVEFTHPDFAAWRIDLTATKSGALSDIGSDIAKMRDELFVTRPRMTPKNILNVLNFNHVDQFEIEIEHIGAREDLTTEELSSAITHIYTVINPNYQTELMYQNEIYHVATKIIKNEKIHHLYRTRYGLKQLTNQAIALMKTTYKDIFPPVGYYLTEKADGIRCIVSIQGDRCRLIADELIEFGISDVPANAPVTIADAELLRGTKHGDSGAIQLMLFDVMWLNGEDLTNKPFSERFDYLDDAAKTISEHVTCKPKSFTLLTADNLEQAFTDTWEGKYPYDVDGLIITSPDSSYKETRNYKWKPPTQNTIDFLAVKCPKSMLGKKPYVSKPKHTLYLLFVSISSNLHQRLGVDLLPEYKQLFPDIDLATADVYPIQFATADYPLAYLYYHPSNAPVIDTKIVELGKATPDAQAPWKLIHVREDRSYEHNYYGNNYKIADIIWQNFVAPFPFEDLWQLNVGYFQTTRDDAYSALTAFHSFVKSHLTRQYFENKNFAVDLASGRGADLNRYQSAGVRNTVFVDSDRVALTELVNRKYYLIEDGRFRKRMHRERDTPPMVIHILVADLTTNADDLVKELSVFKGVGESTIDAVACHFAIHYLCDTVPHIRNLLTLVNKILKKNGVFVFTTMSGERVFDKLQKHRNNETWELKENSVTKYAIRKKYSGKTLSEAGQMVSVKLPFTDGEFYDEPLANTSTIIENAESLGFECTTNESFEGKLKDFERNNRAMFKRLSDNDKEYSALHQYVVLTKKNDV